MWCVGVHSLVLCLCPQYLVHSDPLDQAQAIGQAGLFLRYFSIYCEDEVTCPSKKTKSSLNQALETESEDAATRKKTFL